MRLIRGLFAVSMCVQAMMVSARPNFIVIFTDDQGYADLGSYGAEKIATPHIDKMAEEGVRFTDFYVASSVCSASRAALLSGQRPAVNGVEGVYWPGQKGMAPEVLTIAELLKGVGYQTGLFGKWHLGDHDATRPLGQGFDEYFGIPYSNDMYPHFSHRLADTVTFNRGYNRAKFHQDQAFVRKNIQQKKLLKSQLDFASPLFEGNRVVEYPADQTTLTKRYFERARTFIAKNRDKPFFIFLTPAMPHVPLFASSMFKGKSQGGLYGDVIEEIDYEVGALRAALKSFGLDKNTLLVFASDNGPWLGYKQHAGSAGPLRGGKFTNFEGGVRVPAIMTWPGHTVEGKTSNAVVSALDVFPTLVDFAGVEVPAAHHLDGQSLKMYLTGEDKRPVDKPFFYSFKGKIAGVRQGDWKYLRGHHTSRQKVTNIANPVLFNLKKDISETSNLVDKFPKKREALEALVQSYEKSLAIP